MRFFFRGATVVSVAGVSLFLAACGSSTVSSPSGSSAVATTVDSMSMGATPSMTDHSTMTDSGGATTMPMGGMDMHDQPPASGMKLSFPSTTFAAGTQTPLAFKILNTDGTPVVKYEVEQTKELHLILVRSDLTNYQHLHPTRASDGTWSVPVTFAVGGTYRVVADFVPTVGSTTYGRTTVTADVTVSGTGADTPLPATSTTATVDGYQVTMTGTVAAMTDSTVSFAVTATGGAPAALDQYLGSYGHLVAFAKSDLAYTHIHPASAEQASGMIHFVGHVAASGPHRLFLQFAAGGKVHTAEFTVNVA